MVMCETGQQQAARAGIAAVKKLERLLVLLEASHLSWPSVGIFFSSNVRSEEQQPQRDWF
jgi:hypothetical protein